MAAFIEEGISGGSRQTTEPDLNEIVYGIWIRGMVRAMTTLVSANVDFYLCHTLFLVTWRRSYKGMTTPDHGYPARMVKARKYVDR